MTLPTEDQRARDASKRAVDDRPLALLRREYGEEVDKEARLWDKVGQYYQYLGTSPTPEKVYDYYTGDEHRHSIFMAPHSPTKQRQLAEHRPYLIAQIEQAHAYNPGVPIQSLLNYDSDTLRWLDVEGPLAATGYDLQWYENARVSYTASLEREQFIFDEINRRYDAAVRKGRFGPSALSLLGGVTGFIAGSVLDIGGDGGADREAIEAEVRAEFTAEETQETQEPSLWQKYKNLNYALGTAITSNFGSFAVPALGVRNAFSTFSEMSQTKEVPEMMDVVMGGLDEVGTGMLSLATGVGGMLYLTNPTSGAAVYDWARQSYQRDQEALSEEYHRMASQPERVWLDRARASSVDAIWARMEEESPELIDEYMEMAGGDVSLAMGFFGADVSEQPEVEAQLKAFSEQERDRDLMMIDDLAEADFTFGKEAMDVLAMYGRNVPSRIATVGTLLLTDGDYRDMLVSGQFKKLWDEIGMESSALDHTPSAALGIDGTAIGLGYDILTPIAADPTTWFFGPKFSSVGGTAARAATEATALSRSAQMARVVDDFIGAAQSPARGASAVYNLAGWLDGLGYVELLDRIGMVSKSIPMGKWRTLAGGTAEEMSTATLMRLIPADDVARIRASVGPEALKHLGDNIAENGFDDVVTITISRADQTVHLSDGVKRVLASVDGDIGRVPARINVVDEAAKGTTAVPGYSIAESAVIRQLAGNVDDVKKLAQERGVPVKAGADEAAREFSLNDPVIMELVDNPAHTTTVGKITTRHGDEMPIYRTVNPEDTSEVVYTVKRADGTGFEAIVIGAVGKETPAAGLMIAVSKNRALVRGMDTIWDVALANKDDFLLQSVKGNIASVSDQGFAFINRRAKMAIADAPGELPTAGLPGAEVFPNGFVGELANTLDGVGTVPMRPSKVLLFEDLNPGLTRESIMEVVEQSILRGATPADSARRGVLIGQNGMIRDLLRRGTPRELRRLFTQANTTTRVPLVGGSSVKNLIEQTIKVWGDDIAKADEWVERIQRAVQNSSSRMSTTAEEVAEVQGLAAQVKQLLAMNQGAVDNTGLFLSWDDAVRQAGGSPDDLVPSPVARQLTPDQPASGRVGAGMTDEMRMEQALADEAVQATPEMQMERALGADPSSRLSRVRANHAQLQETLSDTLKELEKKTRALHNRVDTLPDTREMHTIVKEMWEDYNRTYIVPRWSKEIAASPKIFDEELGIVKWDFLQRGVKAEAYVESGSSGWLPTTLIDEAVEAGIAEPEKLARMLNSILDTPLQANLPISPLDLIAAGTRSGARWTRYTHNVYLNTIREGTHAFNRAWAIDKVLRPATAMTVAGDELLRIFHVGGLPAVKRYVNDRLLFTQSRVHNALHGGNPVSRNAVREGAQYSPRVRARLAELDYYTVKARQWERIFYDGYGNGWIDIPPGSPEYLDAAKQWTGQMVQQSGFRAFLRGKEAFTEWFFGVDGQHLRGQTLMVPGPRGATTRVLTSVDEAYDGWSVLFDDVILSRAKETGAYSDVRQAFVDVAKQVDDVAGNTAIDLPDWVFDHLGSVRGLEKNSRNAFSPLRMTDAFFDRAFLDPVNYRRGFVAEMIGKVESARLESLYASQGIQILSDMEVAHALGYKGLQGAVRTGVAEFIAEQGIKRGMVPRSYIDNLVQKAVDNQIEHMLYVTDRGSRAGSIASNTLFPFGRPYADMMAFWSREMLRRPHWRGQINDENLNLLQEIVTAKGNFNPRTPALVSRLAHTDFKIDQGWIGEAEEGETKGLFPGSESTNLSPLLFLPTAGDDSLSVLLPGAGAIPGWAVDMAVAAMKDPIDDPLGYQQLKDQVGQIFSGVHFGSSDPTRSIIQRAIGGGTFGQLLEAAADVNRLFGNNGQYREISNYLGNPGREIDRGRYMSAVLSDPSEWEELMSLTRESDVALYLDALAAEADKNAATGNLMEQVTRFAMPAGNKFVGELDMIWDVWVDAAVAYPELASSTLSDTATPEERRKYVDEVRGNFFDLPQWKRDAYVAGTPQLAVNMISTWDWTDTAHADGIAGGRAYRTTGSREDLARHETYINLGYIRPLSPQERGRRIVGLHLAAKEATAKRVYEQTASRVNDYLWENLVSDDTIALLDGLLSEFPTFAKNYDIQSPRELWDAWSTYEADLEEFAAGANAIDAERGTGDVKTPFDYLREIVNVPGEEKPWGTSWPGVDPTNLSNRFDELTLTEDLFSEETQIMADIIGVELTPGMTGRQLYTSLQEVEVSTTGALSLNVDPSYQSYLGERSAAMRVADENLREVIFDQRYDPDWRQTLKEFVEFETRSGARYRDAVLGVPPERQVEVQDRYMRIMNTADDNVITDWQALWELRYERAYGPLGWTPPEPLSPFDESGGLVGTAYQPFVQRIIDGDSMVVTDRSGAQRAHEVRILGVRARDFGLDNEGAEIDKDRLNNAFQQALRNGDKIYLVRQPETFGNTDIYGRELAWLWIGDTPFSFPEEMLPNRDPSGPSKLVGR